MKHGRVVVALALVLGWGLSAHASSEPTLDTCRAQMRAVREALELRDDLRDEAYTAIMWFRMDAEAALARNDARTCIEKLDMPRRALGIHEASTRR